MKNGRTGSKAGGAMWVVLIIVAVIGGLGVWYLVSKPFAARVDETTRQATQWTPEQINKNPSGYFSWAIGELTRNVEKLKANALALKIEKAKAERSIAENTTRAESSAKTLDMARAAYKALPDTTVDGQTVKQFPLTVAGVTFDTLNAFKLECYKLENRRKIAEANTTNFKAIIQKINSWLEKISVKQTEAEIKLETANAQLAMLKASQTIDGIGGLAKSINSLLDEMGVVASDSDPARVGRSLIDVAEQSETPTGGLSDAAFNALMGL